MRIAAMHVLEAQDQLGITRANQFPFVTANAGGTVQVIEVPTSLLAAIGVEPAAGAD